MVPIYTLVIAMHALNRSRFYELDRVATLDVPGRCVKLQTKLEKSGR